MVLVCYCLGYLSQLHLLWKKSRSENNIEIFVGQMIGLNNKVNLFDIVMGISHKGFHMARSMRKIRMGTRDMNPNHTFRTATLWSGSRG